MSPVNVIPREWRVQINFQDLPSSRGTQRNNQKPAPPANMYSFRSKTHKLKYESRMHFT